jgi:hypothetical protein
MDEDRFPGNRVRGTGFREPIATFTGIIAKQRSNSVSNRVSYETVEKIVFWGK